MCPDPQTVRSALTIYGLRIIWDDEFKHLGQYVKVLEESGIHLDVWAFGSCQDVPPAVVLAGLVGLEG